MAKKPQTAYQSTFAFLDRPHHRTTTLTVSEAAYEKVANLRPGEETKVEFVNDIVSSARGGGSVVHHSIRRIDLLRRQLQTEFRNVKVRAEMGTEVNCLLVGWIGGESDACYGTAKVRKRY